MEPAMEFKIKRNIFLEGMQKTLGIVEKKTTMPILNNVLIRTDQDRIKIIATDREIGLVADYEAQILKDGDITLSARKIYEMIREIQGEIIHVQKNEQCVVSLQSQKSVYKIPGIPADDFPNVAVDQDMKFVRVKGDILKNLILKTSFSMSTDEIRKNLNGIFIDMDTDKPGGIRAVATDGHRLAMISVYLGDKDFLKLEKGIIIPRKGVSEIRKLVENESGDIWMGVHPGMCVLKTDHTMLKVSLIDADYPDYRRVIPTEKGTTIQFERDAALHALRRMSVISSERYSGVIIKLTDGKIILNSTNPDVGEANDEIEVSGQVGEMEVAYNVNYLIDAIEAIDEKDVVFEIGAGMKPGVVRPQGNDQFFCIIMPLRI
jgi:DNA polymerase-3 subunit beta